MVSPLKGSSTPRVLHSEAEFLALMEDVDAQLIDRGIAVPWRPFIALSLVGRALGTDLGYPPPERSPRAGVYQGDDLVLHMDRWFKERYGAKLVEYWGPGRSAFQLRGAFWTFKFPLLLAEMGDKLILHTGSLESASQTTEGRPVNVCELVEDWPAGLTATLTQDEQDQLIADFKLGYEALTVLRDHDDDELLAFSAANVEEAAHNLTCSSPSWGLSKWASLQAVEKALKAYLKRKSVAFGRTHNLGTLARLATQAGMPAVSPALIAAVQCSTSVRYDEPVSKEEALAAHRASLELIRQIAMAL